MQFYMLDENPEVSVSLLPKYAITKVNCREGYQILSDIGHILGIHWKGQNKLYSSSHALTRHFCSSPEILKNFLDHYEYNLLEYKEITGKEPIWLELFYKDIIPIVQDLLNSCFKNVYEQNIHYLVQYKQKHLTKDEADILTNKLLRG